jgi:hypothetical protein
MRASVQEAATAEARIAELQAALRTRDHYLAQSRELARAVQFVLRPFVSKPTKRPKWAHHLQHTLIRLTNQPEPK